MSIGTTTLENSLAVYLVLHIQDSVFADSTKHKSLSKRLEHPQILVSHDPETNPLGIKRNSHIYKS